MTAHSEAPGASRHTIVQLYRDQRRGRGPGPDIIDEGQVLRIALEPMGLARRNHEVTLAYSKLSEQMAACLGDRLNANWCTFGVWGSSSAGTGIRTTSLPNRVASGVRGLPLPAGARTRFEDRLIALRSSGYQHPIRLLAAGNRGVFYEIGLMYARFLERFETPAPVHVEDRNFADLASSMPEMPPELGTAWPEVDPTGFVDGFRAYLEARRTGDPIEKAELMLAGNLLMADYEQRRLDGWLNIALLEPLLRIRRRGGRSRRPSPRTEQAWQRFMTRRVLSVELGPESLKVGNDLTAPKGEAFIPDDLRHLRTERLRAVLESLDRQHLTAGRDWDGSGTAARNWADIDDRLRFVAVLFRSRQQYPPVWMNPYTRPDVAAIASGRDPVMISTALTTTTVGPNVAPVVTGDDLDRLRDIGDAPVDRVVAEFYAASDIARSDQHYRALMGELGRPRRDRSGVVDRYLTELGPVPRWADPARIRSGQDFYRTWRLPLNLALLVGSLPEAYGASQGVEVLYLVSTLVDDPVRRIGQTAQFVLDVTLGDPLDPSSVAGRSIRGVRLMHAGVRHMVAVGAFGDSPAGVAATERWKPEWGAPVNQEDLLGTLLSFVVPPLDFLERTGIPYDPVQAEDYLHLWCVVGGLLGVDESVLCDPPHPERTMSLAQARDAAALIRSRHQEPSLAGQRLMEALLDELVERSPPGLKRIPGALVRLAIGDELADALRVPPRGLTEYALERGVRVGSALRTDPWYQWLFPRIVYRLGEEWYRIFADGGYAADPAFRFTPSGSRDRRRAVGQVAV